MQGTELGVSYLRCGRAVMKHNHAFNITASITTCRDGTGVTFFFQLFSFLSHVACHGCCLLKIALFWSTMGIMEVKKALLAALGDSGIHPACEWQCECISEALWGRRCCVVNLYPFPLMSPWDLCDIFLVFSLPAPFLLRTVFSTSGPLHFPWQRHKNITLPVMASCIPTPRPAFMKRGHISLPSTYFVFPYWTKSTIHCIRMSKKQISS